MTAPPDRISLKLVLFFLLLRIVNRIDRQFAAAFAGDIMRDLDLSRSQFALIAVNSLGFLWASDRAGEHFNLAGRPKAA